MANCPHMESCRLFPLFTMSGTLAVWKTNYCSDKFAECARFKLATEARPVPDNLLPNGQLLKKAK